MKERVLIALVLGALWPAAAGAQTTDPVPGAPDPETVRLRFGPLWVKPTVALTDVGVDTNVFNVDESETPQSDFTLTFTPAADLWLRFGPTWFKGTVKEDLVWFKEFSSENATNGSYTFGWTVPLNYMTLTADGAWASSKKRPGFEIDERVDQLERGYNGGAEIRVFPKTFFGAKASRRIIEFDDEAVFDETNLRDELNRVETKGSMTVRHALTPLTIVTFDLSKQQDRFDYSPLRDADSTLTTGGLAFAPDAFISGAARIGFRNFEPLDSNVPEFSGMIASLDLSYVARGATKIGVQSSRDVQYSYDVNQPYYLLTGVSGSIAQQIFGPVDVEGRIVRQRLSYRNRAGATVEVVDRVDRVGSEGMGVGYHVGEDLRVGFNVDRYNRSSDVVGHDYKGLRYGTAITYGF